MEEDCFLDAPFSEVQLNIDPSLREKAVKLEQKRTDFKKLFKEYSAMMMTLNQKEDFTDKQIVDVGRMIDRWRGLYLKLCGSSQVTNYIHALIAGHITYFCAGTRICTDTPILVLKLSWVLRELT